MMATGLATATGLPGIAGLPTATGLVTAAGDGLARATGDALPFGLAVGAGSASIAVGVSDCGDPEGVGGLETFVAGEVTSAPLLHAVTSTLNTAASNIL
jgi:hypothetical protein